MFRKGDKVRCVFTHPNNSIHAGKIYVIAKDRGGYVDIEKTETPSNLGRNYARGYFELAMLTRIPQFLRMLKRKSHEAEDSHSPVPDW